MKIPGDMEDHALAIGKAALQVVPVLGPALASLIADYVPSRHQEAQERMVRRLADRVEEMGSAINAAKAQAEDAAAALDGFVHKEEFGKLYARCALAAATSQDELRVNAAAEILANSLFGEENGGLPFNKLDHFANCLASLSPDAIRVLAEAAKMVPRAQRADHRSTGDTRITFGSLGARLPFQPSETMAMVYRLQSAFLMYCGSAPPIQSPQYQNWNVYITQLGKDFVEHITNKATIR